MPEAKLAREAQIAYASLAMVTDYDCWNPRAPHVTSDFALANLLKNAGHAQQISRAAVQLLGAERPASDAHTALAAALISQPQHLQGPIRERVETLLA
jgi:5'-methylthioadenosine phosphorylase